MSLIHMVGPNAIGKTTALLRWAARYPQLLAISADSGFRYDYGVKTSAEDAWKGTSVQKEAIIGQYRQIDQVVLVESARTTTLLYSEPHEPAILVVCDWQLHRKHMEERCQRRGKKFRADYWNQRKLAYECERRYRNFAAKNLNPRQFKLFTIHNQAEDWPAVDEYFGSLFRRLHNEINHRRQK